MLRKLIGTTAVVVIVMSILRSAATVAPDPYTPVGWAITLLGAPVFIFTIGSLYEWLVHRFLYHGKSRLPVWRDIYVIHHRGHHWHRFPPDRYVEHGPLNRIPVVPPEPFDVCESPRSRAIAWLMQFMLYFGVGIVFTFIPTWLVTQNLPFTLASIASGFVCSYLFIRVHDLMHYPQGAWLERRGWFRFLNRHHYIHHVDPRANLNFMLPLCDLLFGTLRRTMTEAECEKWPTFEEAAYPPAA